MLLTLDLHDSFKNTNHDTRAGRDKPVVFSVGQEDKLNGICPAVSSKHVEIMEAFKTPAGNSGKATFFRL